MGTSEQEVSGRTEKKERDQELYGFHIWIFVLLRLVNINCSILLQKIQMEPWQLSLANNFMSAAPRRAKSIPLKSLSVYNSQFFRPNTVMHWVSAFLNNGSTNRINCWSMKQHVHRHCKSNYLYRAAFLLYVFNCTIELGIFPLNVTLNMKLHCSTHSSH